MSNCELEVRFDRDDRTYRPGDPVRGEVVAVTDEDVSCKGLSIELLWQTHGAGNTDRQGAAASLLYQYGQKPLDLFAAGGACPHCGTHFGLLPCQECGATRPLNEWLGTSR